MQEQWARWEPVAGLAPQYYIERVLEDFDEGFKVVLFEASNRKRKVHIKFKRSVECYTMTDESYVSNLLINLREQYGLEFYRDSTFFKVTNSDYLKRLSVLSSGISDEFDFTHFVVFGLDSMLDIIAKYEPEIEFENLPE